MRTEMKSHLGTIAVGIVAALCLAVCVLIADAATRLAYELKDGAATLRKEGDAIEVEALH
jgi:hypothetical protein